ncbi:hypothetical protein GCM10023340_17520 [Nocardioides marinquilinus]|uniref:PaaI family thioesterase n=1 Tax=Nocardioides marinquilinus TaxID=1210400 RepID=A0ABP9PJ24_9ACTN
MPEGTVTASTYCHIGMTAPASTKTAIAATARLEVRGRVRAGRVESVGTMRVIVAPRAGPETSPRG